MPPAAAPSAASRSRGRRGSPRSENEQGVVVEQCGRRRNLGSFNPAGPPPDSLAGAALAPRGQGGGCEALRSVAERRRSKRASGRSAEPRQTSAAARTTCRAPLAQGRCQLLLGPGTSGPDVTFFSLVGDDP